MLKIKLYPRGKKHQRTFRIVVAERRSKFNGKFVQGLGFWTPQTKTIQIDQAKLKQWQLNGAQLTIGVDKLINPDKYPRRKKVKTETKEIKPIKETKAPKESETPVQSEVSQEPKTETPTEK